MMRIVEPRSPSSPYYQRAGVTLYHGDALEIAPRLPRFTPSLVVMDPPYSSDVHKSVRSGAREKTGNAEHGTATAPANVRRAVDLGFDHLSPALRRGLARLARSFASRWTLVFSDLESTWLWRHSLECAGVEYVRQGTWAKLGAAPQFTGDRPAVGAEAIVIGHARKPDGKPMKKAWNGGGRPGVYYVPIVLSRGKNHEQREHKAQKPEELMVRLLQDFASPGDTIYDFTMGSGSTGVAAARLGLGFVGIDGIEGNCAIATRRIDAELDRISRGEAPRIQYPDRRPRAEP